MRSFVPTPCSPIAVLFGRSRPPAIVWRIWTIVIDAIQRILPVWSAPHVIEKCGEGAEPSFADSNPAPSPTLIVAAARISATTNHIPPNAQFWTNDIAASLTVRCAPLRKLLLAKAAAATSVARAEGINRKDANVSAVTLAAPGSASVAARSFVENDEPSEPLAEKVKLGGHQVVLLSGVMREAVSAALPLNFTRNGAAI